MLKVSVIIPAYNAMTYLPKTLESVLQQTFTDFEVLIINDGSSDNIVQWAEQIVDSRVKLISQENQRLAAARNTGIAHAQGEYIAFLDADDLWEPTKLEKQVRCLEEHPKVGLVHSWTLLVDSEGKVTGKVLKSQIEGDAWQQIVQKNTVVVSSVIVRSSCLETVGVFDRDLHYCEDYDMWIRLASRYPFAVVKEPLTRYRLHPGTLSTHCQGVLQSFRILIERAFQSAPIELLYLRNRGYGNENLYLAWRSLNNQDYKQAIHFQEQALAHYPQLRYSWECIRLGLAIAVMQLLKPDGYSKVLELIYTLRRRISSSIAR
ncbi:glycosyltransferase family 2 protein [Iningainema tapete]|uniref:Glycosyltransferase n=1 Tax=Iningainema tapete BLCC-T55 TaxID=2748662 RepID=A0A8J6XSQ0_9CYAN|nr:glycosyltransferase family 2 protein [Iningainema tapete]MBD2778481.1 glycosyltransferase [Iningainema tapete BLCC-T55]